MAEVSPSRNATDELLNGIEIDSYNQPDDDAKIYKDECMYCYNTPFFEGGLFVCLKSFCCLCVHHVVPYSQKRGTKLFINIESKKIPVISDDTGEPKEKMTKISRLAIGAESTYDVPKFEVEDSYKLVLYPALDKGVVISRELGDDIYRVCQKVIESVSAERLQLLQNASNAWDGEVKSITKHADLKQDNNGKIIPPSGWRCEEEGCDMTENLWLNLTDGAIRCGRTQFISEGVMSKGNNHMKMYYDLTGYPLVVKMGTICNDGTTDVYSYDEDDAVIDPNLKAHLAHFGIDEDKFVKTEKSTLEMELDMNQKWEWAKCQEDGASLESIYGPGYTGIINIGSSCYINSVVQALLLVPDFQKRFGVDPITTLDRISIKEVPTDFNAQVMKLFSSLYSGEYAKENSEHNGVKPTQFKRIVAGNHAEFCTAKQQDAEEYARFILEKISEKTDEGQLDPTVALKFQVETRFEDLASGLVRYSNKEETLLALPVPPHALKPKADEENRFEVEMNECLQAAFGSQMIEGFTSPVTGETKGATNTIRLKTFPDFLLVQIQKFTMAENYTVKKLDIDLNVEEILYLDDMRGDGMRMDEKALPEDTPSPPALPAFDIYIVDQLEMMGFTRNAATKAAIETRRGGVEEAAEWLMMRLDDPSLNEPYTASIVSATSKASPAGVAQLVDFGFTAHQAKYALGRNPDVNAAAEWLFSNSDQVPPEVAEVVAPKPPCVAEKIMRDGHGTYKLVGFISHMGSSPHSGHYVAHLKKNDKWILFNDEKVAISQNPPRQLGYLYIYQRLGL